MVSVTLAKDLGWVSGEWPETFVFFTEMDTCWTRVCPIVEVDDGEATTVGWLYKSSDGHVLRVYGF
jgi:hypothetical protein